MAIQQMFLGIGASEEQNYWYANIGGSGTEDTHYGRPIHVDSSGNVHTSGRSLSSPDSSSDLCLIKHDKDGTLLWQTSVEFGGYPYGGCVLDDSGNIYSSGLQNYSNYGSWDTAIFKHNSSGVLQWQRWIGGSSSEQVRGMCIDSSNNIYIVGETETSTISTYNDILYVKYNSSGVLQFQKSIGSDVRLFLAKPGAATDSSDNIYITARWSETGVGHYQNMVMKLNSSGTLQWAYGIAAANDSDAVRDAVAAVDSSDNIYFGIHNDTESTLVVLKYNSAGTLQWQREITGAPTGVGDINEVDGISTDSDDNVYVVTLNGTGNRGPCIFKWNSSGTLQWQRFWKASDATDSCYYNGIATLEAHSFYLVTSPDPTTALEGGVDRLVVKLPADGTLTGTHGDYIYQSISYTEGAGDYVETSVTPTVQTTSMTEAVATFSTSTPTLTNTVTVID